MQPVAIPSDIRNPTLVTTVRNLGPKAHVATALGRYDSLGEDLVAACLDDLAAAGATPMATTFATTGQAGPAVVEALAQGVRRACAASAVPVEQRLLHRPSSGAGTDAFDLLVIGTGFGDAADLIDRTMVQPGDVIVGIVASGLAPLASSELHAALVRRGVDLAAPSRAVLREWAGGEPDEPDTEPGLSIADAILAPRRSVAGALAEPRAALRRRGLDFHAAGALTGALSDDLVELLPDGFGARIRPDAWEPSDLMRLYAALADLDGPGLRARLDSGLGMVLVVPPMAVARLGDQLWQAGAPNSVIGEVVAVEPGAPRYSESPPGS